MRTRKTTCRHPAAWQLRSVRVGRASVRHECLKCGKVAFDDRSGPPLTWIEGSTITERKREAGTR
jgi:hypothetical protein